MKTEPVLSLAFASLFGLGGLSALAQERVLERTLPPQSPAPSSAPTFLRGDSDADGEVTMTDALVTLSALFLGQGEVSCADAADADDSGELTLADAVVTLNFLFSGRDGIAAPGPRVCSVDSTPDALDCSVGGSCADSAREELLRVAGGGDRPTSFSSTAAFLFKAVHVR